MAHDSDNTRLEAFCDGVFAIAITLLVIEIRVPHDAVINDAADLWRVLGHMMPSMFAFLLSFCVILITWANHHAQMKLVPRSSGAFIYANGFLLLTVAFTPFPTALLGEYIFTDHAAPAVVFYDGVLSLQALSWVFMCGAALRGRLVRDEKAESLVRQNGRFGWFAFGLYGLCALLAFWIPLVIAIITTLTWAFWLVHGIRLKPGAVDAT